MTQNPDNNSNLSYKKQKRQLNIGIIICAVILIYLVVYFFVYYFSSKSTIFEVTAGSTASQFDGQYTAMALREEKTVPSVGTGYVNFFVGDATPIRVGEKTYILDSSGTISARLEEAAKSQSILSKENLQKIRDTIFDFDTSFQEQTYYDTYAFKYRMESQILDLINSSVFDAINQDLAGMGENTYQLVNSDTSGVIIHCVDGYEETTPNDIEAADFKKTNYEKHIIRTNDLLAEGDPVYKVITSEKWNLVFQISHPEAFEDFDYLNIEFLKDNVTATADFEMFTKAGNTYGVLTFEKYMIRYLSDRYLQIRIIEDATEGLKIPKTAVTEKQFYKIPLAYLTQGGDSSTYGFNKEVILEDGTTSIVFTTPQILRKTETDCYVSTDSFKDGDILIMPETNSRYQIGEKENLEGVYIVNNGFSAFRLIEILGENNSFYIISPDLAGGVRIYDQVIRNGSKVTEGEVVNR